MDRFTQLRIAKFVREFRERSGQMPTWNDLEAGGFDRDLVKAALKAKVLEEFFVTLTNGTIVKGFKLGDGA